MPAGYLTRRTRPVGESLFLQSDDVLQVQGVEDCRSFRSAARL